MLFSNVKLKQLAPLKSCLDISVVPAHPEQARDGLRWVGKGKEECSLARRHAAKPSHPGTRVRKEDRHLHISVLYLRLQELKPGAGDAQQSEVGMRGLPGQPGTGSKPLYLHA